MPKTKGENMIDYDEVMEFINDEILEFNPMLLNCYIHFLPENLENNVEYIFTVSEEATEDDILNFRSDVDYKLFRYYDKHDYTYDFITILSKI